MRTLILALLFSFLTIPAHAYLLAVGHYTGDTDNNNVDIQLSTTCDNGCTDFAPDLVIIKCNIADNPVFATTAMTAGNSCIFNGTACNLTTAILNLTGASNNGFRVGTDARVQGDSTGTKVCYYMAVKDDGKADFTVGSYTGQAGCTDSCDVCFGTGAGCEYTNTSTSGSADFTPGMVYLHRNGTSQPCWRTSSMTGDFACNMNNAACASNKIQSFASNGFQHGGNAQAYVDGATYYYFAFKDVSGFTTSGTYNTGAAKEDNTNVTVGFLPDFVILKGNSATAHYTARFKGESGDASFNNTAAEAANQIQNLTGASNNGFQIGTSDVVQEVNTDFYWWAILIQAVTGVTTQILN